MTTGSSHLSRTRHISSTRRRPSRSVWLAMLLALGVGFATPAYAEDLVPDVVGLDGARAKSMIEQAGYTVVAMYDETKPAGRVFSQKPGGLAARTKGTLVQIFVGGADPSAAQAPDPVPVPVPVRPPTPAPVTPVPVPPVPVPVPVQPPTPVVPATPEPGTPRPTNPIDLGAPPTGLDEGLPTVPAPTPVQPAPVQPAPIQPAPMQPDGMMPAAPADLTGLEMIPPGRLPSSDGPEIPSVLGRTLAQAREELGQWRVVVMRSLSIPSLEGTVINQWPFPGRKFAAGEGVVVVVAITKAAQDNLRTVPDVTGFSPADARRTVEQAELGANLRTVPSDPIDYGRVVGQLPMADCLVAPGTSIRVWIGRGQGDEPVPAPMNTPGVTLPDNPQPVLPAPDALPPMPDPLPNTPPSDLDPVTPRAPDPVSPLAPPTPMDPPTPVPVAPRTLLGAPSLTSPPANESYPRAFGATFSWTTVSGATSYDWELQEEQPTGDWKPIESLSFTEARYRPERMKKGRFRWRVRARSGADVGTWSGWLRLYMY